MVKRFFLSKITWSLFMVLAFSINSCFAFRDASEIKECFEPYTQTGAYLRNGKEVPVFLDAFFQAVNDYYEKKGLYKTDMPIPQDHDFDRIIKDFAELENFYGETHHVFYHGTHAFYIFIQDLIRVFYKVFFNIDQPNDLPMLRLAYKEFKEYADVDALIAKGMHRDGGDTARKLCLAAGITPFSSSCNINRATECPLNYFFAPNIGGGGRNLGGALSSYEILKGVFNFFGLGEKFETHGLKLLKKVEDSQSENPISKYIHYDDNWMIQVFIPVDKTNRYVWNADPCGYGDKCLLVKKVRLHFDKTACFDVFCPEKHMFTTWRDNLYDKESEITVAEFLNLYKKDKEKAFLYAPCNYDPLACALDRLQVRIYLDPKAFYNSDSGVKIFRHVRKQKSKETRRDYFRALESFAQHLKQSSQCSIL